MTKFTPRRHLTGGLRLPAHKTESTEADVLRMPLPAELWVSTRQHSGPAAEPVVTPGQRVLRGETVARATSPDSADVHAPATGRVARIESRPVPLASSVSAEPCIVIATDPAADTSIADTAAAGAGDAVDELRRAGIVGLGGAVFPTAAKIRSAGAGPCELLVINGAECEPYISCDDMLMRESPDAIVRGAARLMEIAGAQRCIIAIERDKPQAIEAMTQAVEQSGNDNISIAELPSIYPAGGERQLLDVLAGIEIPDGRYPGDYGCLCQNVGTACAIDNWFERGLPLVSRIVTVTGSAVAHPRNVEALIGTPIRELVAACGGYKETPARLIHGGSMMGFALPGDDLPVTKSTNCIVAAHAEDVRSDATEWPCIRCGECAIACPARLQPQDLLIAARAGDQPLLQSLALSECIECGCCDIVCPSHIPLTDTFRRAKPGLRHYRQQQTFMQDADLRYQSRESRRAQTQQTEESRRAILKQSLATEREREIRAAVERARQRKTRDAGHDD